MSERAYGRLLDKCEKLEADNERLTAALKALVKHFDQYKDAECCKRVIAQARRAQETKP